MGILKHEDRSPPWPIKVFLFHSHKVRAMFYSIVKEKRAQMGCIGHHGAFHWDGEALIHVYIFKYPSFMTQVGMLDQYVQLSCHTHCFAPSWEEPPLCPVTWVSTDAFFISIAWRLIDVVCMLVCSGSVRGMSLKFLDRMTVLILQAETGLSWGQKGCTNSAHEARFLSSVELCPLAAAALSRPLFHKLCLCCRSPVWAEAEATELFATTPFSHRLFTWWNQRLSRRQLVLLQHLWG